MVFRKRMAFLRNSLAHLQSFLQFVVFAHIFLEFQIATPLIFSIYGAVEWFPNLFHSFLATSLSNFSIMRLYYIASIFFTQGYFLAHYISLLLLPFYPDFSQGDFVLFSLSCANMCHSYYILSLLGHC